MELDFQLEMSHLGMPSMGEGGDAEFIWNSPILDVYASRITNTGSIYVRMNWLAISSIYKPFSHIPKYSLMEANIQVLVTL